MITFQDVFARIGQRMQSYGCQGSANPMASFPAAFDLRLAITTDLEETALDFRQRYGPGEAFHFPLADYGHGKLLAGQLYRMLLGLRPDMSAYTGGQFGASDPLFLFLHVRKMPMPAAVGAA